MKNAGKARSYGLYRHLRTSKEIIENLLNYLPEQFKSPSPLYGDNQYPAKTAETDLNISQLSKLAFCCGPPI